MFVHHVWLVMSVVTLPVIFKKAILIRGSEGLIRGYKGLYEGLAGPYKGAIRPPRAYKGYKAIKGLERLGGGPREWYLRVLQAYI